MPSKPTPKYSESPRQTHGIMVSPVAHAAGAGIVHMVLRKNDAADSLWWHMPFVAFCFIMEVANVVVIAKVTSYLQSDYFQWSAPFVFSLTAVITRRAAELSGVPLSAASRISAVSLGFGVFFPRLAQSAVLDDVGQFMTLELYYAILGIILKTSLYSRHAAFWMSRKCKIRAVPRSARAQGILTVSNISESIFDSAAFIIFSLSRFLLMPSKITTPMFALVLCGGLAVQMVSNAATFSLLSYLEGIPIKDFHVPWTTLGGFWQRWVYHWAAMMWGTMYLTPVVLYVWDPSMRIVIPWK